MPIRVLVVDDSALMRSIVVNMLSTDDALEIVDIARDGLEAVEKTKLHSPDVVTLDIEMPRLNGLEALKLIMRECPTRVIMLSSLSSPETTYEAISQGAVDFIAKPPGAPLANPEEFVSELIDKIKAAAMVSLSKLVATAPAKKVRRLGYGKALFMNKVVAIGSSTGGPKALETVLESIPEELPAALLIVQHLPVGFSKALADRLNERSTIQAKEAEDGDEICPGFALIAPAGYHMVVAKGNGQPRVALEDGQKLWGVKPAADKLMVSVAERFGTRSVGVLLSGMGVDGADGLSAIKRRHGKTIVQDEATSIIFGMPKAAIEKGSVDEVLPVTEIARALGKICAKKVGG